MRILVADDEAIEREALRYLVQRHLPDVQVVGEAATGRQAVDMVEALRPDVVLLDIEMPGLSGLEALQEIRQRSPQVRCLIVSAYDHFHFAREALRLGAQDYLLKPVKRDQMVEVLLRLKREIAVDRQRRQDELMQKEQFRQLRPLAESELVGLLEQGDGGVRTGDLANLLGLKFDASICVVVRLAEGPLKGVPSTEAPGKIREAYERLLSMSHALCACAVGAWSGEQTTLMIELASPVNEYAIRIWSLDLARHLRDRVKEQTGVRFRMGIGQPCDGLHLLGRSYQEALAALRFDGPSEKVNHYGDLEVQGDLLTGGPSSLAEAPQRWHPTPAVLKAIEQGKRFMAVHFGEELSLERIAKEVSLTPYYYSKIFSRVVGQTVLDYVTAVRVEHAKRMLIDPAVSIKEACFAVGYSDPNYFSRVFKRVTNQTPTQYRLRLLN